MPDQKDPLGILGDSTKQQKDPLGILTGDPVKKKEVGGFGSIAGGLIGTGGDGRSVSSGLMGGIKKIKPTQKPDISGIEAYNKNFREITGTRGQEFSLGSDLPQIKKAREEKDYLKFRDIEENELKPVINAVRQGTASPQQLQTLYSKPYGRKIVSDVITAELPELAGVGGLDPEIVRSGEKWQGIAQRLQEKNRPAAIEAQNQSEFALDNELDNTFKNFTYGKEELIEGARKGDERQLKETKIPFGAVNTTSAAELQSVVDRMGGMPYVWDAQGNRKSTKDLREKIQERIFQLKAAEDIHPEIVGNRQMILDAVSKVKPEWKRQNGDNPELTNVDADYVMSGLNYIRDISPGEYGMIMRTMEKTGEISDTQFTKLAELGRKVKYFKDFKGGQIIQEDERSLITPQIKQANLAGWLSERLKQMGKSKRAAVPQKDILEAYNDAPEELKDEELLRNIINKERAPAFGFLPIAKGEGITKTGGLPSFMRGIAEPFQAVQNTIEVGFDSPYDAYLKSKKLDIGQQQIPQKGGGYGNVLPSEKFWNKASAGFGSFMSQLFLARGFGAAVKTPINAVIGRVNPMAAITSRDATLKFGTPLSTLSQTYGDEFIDFLEKTGSPVKAGLGAFVSGYTQGIIEKNIMPDVLIAEKASLLLAKKNLAKEIIKVVDNGGGKVGVANAVKDFIVNTTKTIGKEAWLEENLQNLTNVMTEAIISPQTVKDRNVLKETIDTGNAATVMMLIPSLLGGAGETKAKRSLTKSQLNAIAADPKKYIESINNQYSLGQITEQERELALNIINVQRDNILSSPVRDANGDLISAERQLEYAYQSTVQQIAKEQASKITDPIQLEPIEKKIEEADKIKRQIFYGEENKELPSKEGEPVAIDQDRDLMDEGEITPESAIQNAIESGQLKGGNLMSAQAALGMEGGAQMFLQEVADQALNKQGEPATDAENMKRARETYGDELVDMAIAQYPKEVAAKESGISVQMPQEVSKPQTTEIKPAEPAPQEPQAQPQAGNPALRDVESTAKALENANREELELLTLKQSIKQLPDKDFEDAEANENWKKLQEHRKKIVKDDKYLKEQISNVENKKKADQVVFETLHNMPIKKSKFISELYHKAKADGSNPELVKAVEELLGKPKETTTHTAPQAEAAKTKVTDETSTKPTYRTKKEIENLPESERDSAIDDLIYGVTISHKDIFDRKTGKPVKLGVYNAVDFVRDNVISGNPSAVALLNKIIKHPYFSKVKIVVTDKLPEGVHGENVVTQNFIRVGPKVDAETLAHEKMHTLTARIFELPYNSLTASEKELRDGINNIIRQFDPNYEYLDKKMGRLGYKRSEYAQELIAEAFIGSPFSQELRGKTITKRVERDIDRGLIRKIIDKIIEFFGGTVIKTETVEERKNVVDALKEIFVKHGKISSSRLDQINKESSRDRLTINYSRGVDVDAATNRMKEAGFTDEEIAQEFSKRGIQQKSEQAATAETTEVAPDESTGEKLVEEVPPGEPPPTEIKPAEMGQTEPDAAAAGMSAFVEVTRPELGFEEVPTDILDNMDSKTMAVQGKRLEGLNKNLSKLQELFNCIWT